MATYPCCLFLQFLIHYLPVIASGNTAVAPTLSVEGAQLGQNQWPLCIYILRSPSHLSRRRATAAVTELYT